MKRILVGLLLACLLAGGATGVWAAGEAKAKAPTETKATAQAKAPASATAKATAQTPVNINNAGVEQLTTLPGVGRVTAENLVAHRQAKGPFAKAEDLLQVKGIGDKTLAKIRPLIVLQ